jgi:uncharacterized protein (TIGR04222 family)
MFVPRHLGEFKVSPIYFPSKYFPIVVSEKELVFFAFLALFSVGFSRLISWLFRRGSLAEPQLTAEQQAFLLAGPMRAIEIALFLLARDSWVRHDGRGFFHSRFADAPGKLEPLERELLQSIADQGGIKIIHMWRLRLASLDSIDRDLTRNGLILSESDFQLSSILSLLPFILTIGLGCLRLFQESQQLGPGGSFNGILALELLGIAALMFRVRQAFSRRTILGERVEQNVRNDIKERQRIKTENRFSNDVPQDLLWTIKDDILARGLRSLAGTVFAPLSSFVDGGEAEPQDPHNNAAHSSHDEEPSSPGAVSPNDPTKTADSLQGYGSRPLVTPQQPEESAVDLGSDGSEPGAPRMTMTETPSGSGTELYDLGAGGISSTEVSDLSDLQPFSSLKEEVSAKRGKESRDDGKKDEKN